MDKHLIVNTPIRATVLSGVTAMVALPFGTEYYNISQTSGAGTIQWSTVSAFEAAKAATAHLVDSSTPSGNVFSNDRTVYIYAADGDIVYSIFLVREGR